MITYHEDLNCFEYRAGMSNLFCFFFARTNKTGENNLRN